MVYDTLYGALWWSNFSAHVARASESPSTGLSGGPRYRGPPRACQALRRARELLREMRTLAGHEDDTADSDLGRADANLWGLIQDIDHGRFLL